MISSRSSVLSQMLRMESNPEFSPSVTELFITGIPADIMKSILSFIYMDYIPRLNLLPLAKILDIYNASKRLNLQRLTFQCSRILAFDHRYKIKHFMKLRIICSRGKETMLHNFSFFFAD